MENLTIANIALLLGALFVLIGIASSLLASRFGAPLLLIFLVLGMLAGQDGIGGIVFVIFGQPTIRLRPRWPSCLFDGGLRTSACCELSAACRPRRHAGHLSAS